MSFVGTRPEAVKYVEKYKPEYMATLLLPAGITSEASIRYKDEAELKEDFMCKWIDCVTLVESMGDEYKEVYAQNMMRVCQDIISEEYDVLNPVWRNYFSLCVKYKCGLETK